MNTDVDVMRFIGNGSIVSLSCDEFLVHHRRSLSQRRGDEYGLASVIVKETNHYIGACWLKYDSFFDGIELGYRYIKSAWGRGYATEAARAVLTAGFSLPQLDQVWACSHPDNPASIRVLEKLGFVYIFDKYHPVSKREVPVYMIKRTHFT
jgi:RimJ/RimL family protein N-acetyltransferase